MGGELQKDGWERKNLLQLDDCTHLGLKDEEEEIEGVLDSRY